MRAGFFVLRRKASIASSTSYWRVSAAITSPVSVDLTLRMGVVEAELEQLAKMGAELEHGLLPAALQGAPAERDAVALPGVLYLADRLDALGHHEQIGGLNRPVLDKVPLPVSNDDGGKSGGLHRGVEFVVFAALGNPAGVEAAILRLQACGPLKAARRRSGRAGELGRG